ncbi:MAG: hypothetical protein JWO73_458 [Candidatus Taylorbacteria bacterium]|nr:hypothetical protein [Candidatus Taylorbacteria bacterium]
MSQQHQQYQTPFATRTEVKEIIDTAINDLAILVNDQFVRVDSSIDKVCSRIDKLELRFNQLELRIDKLETAMNIGFLKIMARLDAMQPLHNFEEESKESASSDEADELAEFEDFRRERAGA